MLITYLLLFCLLSLSCMLEHVCLVVSSEGFDMVIFTHRGIIIHTKQHDRNQVNDTLQELDKMTQQLTKKNLFTRVICS